MKKTIFIILLVLCSLSLFAQTRFQAERVRIIKGLNSYEDYVDRHLFFIESKKITVMIGGEVSDIFYAVNGSFTDKYTLWCDAKDNNGGRLKINLAEYANQISIMYDNVAIFSGEFY